MVTGVFAQDRAVPTDDFEIIGDLQIEAGLVIATNGVMVTHGNSVLKADRAVLNRETGEIDAAGHVQLQRGSEFWTGERLFYNFKTQRIDTESFRIGFAPFFLQGRGLQASATNQNYLITNVVAMTRPASI